jgi:hypothetical protein
MTFNTIDPLAESRPWESPYAYTGNNPVNRIDPNGLDWYIFDQATGEYRHKQEAEGDHRMVVHSVDENGNEHYRFHDFNDPVYDAKAIDDGEITRFENLSDATVDMLMEKSGVRSAEAQDHPMSYAASTSTTWMDFGTYKNDQGKDQFNKNTLYMREGRAYNIGDIGNYLWGMGMSELGISLGVARAGAHANNIWQGMRGGQIPQAYNLGNNKQPMSQGFWDSPGDQRAIANGYRGHAIMKWKERLQRSGFRR